MVFADFPFLAVSALGQSCPYPARIKVKTFSASYLFSNETLIHTTLNSISSDNIRTKKLHIGFGFWFNLDLIVKRNSNYAIIFDIDENLANMFYCLATAIKQSINKDSFVEQFIAQLRRHELMDCIHSIPDETALREKLKQLKDEKNSWLYSEESFQFLKQMFLQNRIIFSLFDITKTESQTELIVWLARKKHVCSLDTIYLTNIYEWLLMSEEYDKQDTYKKFVNQLLTKDLIIVDAFYQCKFDKSTSGPPQRLSIGTIPNFQKSKRHRPLIPLTDQAPPPIHIPRIALRFD